ncbi:hypothetical protein PPSIR1_36759 [Plesiocystis pacifica SIR-1]|uniref:Ankyrin repeat domain-containing protein n=1 Tax=Plesiocystis pacifica SIR-1 TaxID=391625 RepID=A6G0B7_9BACT|nr:hypothetical protein [Plesiocystis pacifica]EDM80563.1 hypothetical protein PPSIR1_36759 [Plesiocystis pacifica SIR-1]
MSETPAPSSTPESPKRELGIFAFIVIAVGVGCLLIALLGVVNTALDLELVLDVSGADMDVPNNYEVCAGLGAVGVLFIALTLFGRFVAEKFRAAKGKPLVRVGIVVGAVTLLVVAGRGLQIMALVSTYGSMLAYYATDGDLDDVRRELEKGATPEQLDAAVGRAAQYDNHEALKLLLEAGADLRDATSPEEHRHCALGGTGLQFARVALEHGVGPDSCPDSEHLIWTTVDGHHDDAIKAELVGLYAGAGWSLTTTPEFSEERPYDLAQRMDLPETAAALEQLGALE